MESISGKAEKLSRISLKVAGVKPGMHVLATSQTLDDAVKAMVVKNLMMVY